MEKYQEMKTRQAKEFEKLPIFWAFSNKQLEEGMIKFGLTMDDLDKICKVPGGGYMLKTDTKQLGELFLRHNEEYLALIDADKTGDGFIFDMFDYELSNHEYCITWDVSDTLDALGLTIEQVKENPALRHGLARAQKEQRKYAA